MIETRTGYENMRIDWENLLALERGERMEPIFRVYKWSEPTVSIGYSQGMMDFCVSVVRRPTGGGALLHGWDISFSLTDYKNRWGDSFTRIYKEVAGRLMYAFKGFGIDVEISRYRGNYSGYYCFSFPTLGELSVNGKKFLACAMRTMNRAFLLQGSILLKVDRSEFSHILKVPEEDIRVVSAEELGLKEGQILQVLLRSL